MVPNKFIKNMLLKILNLNVTINFSQSGHAKLNKERPYSNIDQCK